MENHICVETLKRMRGMPRIPFSEWGPRQQQHDALTFAISALENVGKCPICGKIEAVGSSAGNTASDLTKSNN